MGPCCSHILAVPWPHAQPHPGSDTAMLLSNRVDLIKVIPTLSRKCQNFLDSWRFRSSEKGTNSERKSDHASRPESSAKSRVPDSENEESRCTTQAVPGTSPAPGFCKCSLEPVAGAKCHPPGSPAPRPALVQSSRHSWCAPCPSGTPCSDHRSGAHSAPGPLHMRFLRRDAFPAPADSHPIPRTQPESPSLSGGLLCLPCG